MPPLGVSGLEAHPERLDKQVEIIQAVADAKKGTVTQEITKYESRLMAPREKNRERGQARRANE